MRYPTPRAWPLVLLFFGLSFQAAGDDHCQPSKWGTNDEIGAANYVNPQQILAATQLVKLGESHGLGIVIEPGMPSFPPRYTQLQVVQPGQQLGVDTTQTYGWQMSYNDDLVQMWLGTGPQLDGLGHLGEGNMFYNCNEGKDFAQITGLTKLGTHQVPPLIGRGILLDMTRHFDVSAMTAGQVITSEDLKAAAKAQSITFKTGDVILLHTGWTDAKLKSEPEIWGSTIPGINNEAANSCGVAYSFNVLNNTIDATSAPYSSRSRCCGL